MHANLNKVDGGRTLCPFNFVIEGTIFEAIAFSMQADSKLRHLLGHHVNCHHLYLLK